jgi:uncharacterized membrane protein
MRRTDFTWSLIIGFFTNLIYVLFYVRAGKCFLGTTLLATGAIVGGVYYATIDPKFRQTVEDKVPHSSSLLGAILEVWVRLSFTQ